MENWPSSIELSRPHWDDYREQLQQLGGALFPGSRELNQLLPNKLCSLGGSSIRFVPACDIPALPYEQHIYTTGEVSTRENNWHDLFNALAWSRFPRSKVAMNAVHFRELDSGGKGSRGKQRDALTLFDESGVIVCSNNQVLLEALARRDWNRIFRTEAGAWEAEISLFVVGHALLEKFLRPYKAITAQALLLQLDQVQMEQSREALSGSLDEWMSERLLAGSLLDAPASLSPLPLMGIPAWWPGGEQNSDFFADQNVFRPLPEGGRVAPVYFCNSV